MKKLITTALVMCVASASIANATGGRLNSSGCHNSSKVGYHCHRTVSSSSSSSNTYKKNTSTITNSKPSYNLVMRTQTVLALKGFDVSIDGLYGPNTENAIKNLYTMNSKLYDGSLDILDYNEMVKMGVK